MFSIFSGKLKIQTKKNLLHSQSEIFSVMILAIWSEGSEKLGWLFGMTDAASTLEFVNRIFSSLSCMSLQFQRGMSEKRMNLYSLLGGSFPPSFEDVIGVWIIRLRLQTSLGFSG